MESYISDIFVHTMCRLLTVEYNGATKDITICECHLTKSTANCTMHVLK